MCNIYIYIYNIYIYICICKPISENTLWQLLSALLVLTEAATGGVL